mgnify:CR=1 FL=1
MGNPASDAPDKPFADKVEAMAGYGLSATDIALVLAMDETELQSVYQRELDAGAIKTNLRVAESLYRQALGDGRQAVTAAIFWLKTRARWKETSVHEVAGAQQPLDLTTWSDEMLEAAIGKLDAQIAELKS